MAFRRVETVVVQRHLGFIDREFDRGLRTVGIVALHAKECANGGTRRRALSKPLSQHGSMKTSPRTCLDRSMLGLGLGVSKDDVENGGRLTNR